MSGLALVKWYADAVAPDGTLVVAYHAELAWRGTRLRLGSRLFAAPGRASRSSVTARPGAAPSWSEAGLTWPAGRLGGRGSWTPLAPPFERTLLSRGGRFLRWRCLAPAARASVGGDEPLEGFGYAERLEMTLAPWNLPIRELRWGRFVSERASLAWIDWRGEHPLHVVLVDGRAAEESVVEERRVAASGAALALGPPTVLREGSAGTSLLRRVPLVADTLPARLLAIQETKWLCRGVLVNDRGTHEGWVIHEVVRWP